jgi:hypothetical protein
MNAKHKMILAGIMLSLTAGFAGAETIPDQIEFKFAHELGKVSRMKMVVKNVGSMKIADPMPEQKFSQVIEQEYQMICKKINPDGTADYEMSIPSIAMKMDAGGFKSEYRVSASDEEKAVKEGPADQKQKTDATFKLWSAMTRCKFTLILDASGKAIKVEGFAEAMEKAQKELGTLSAMEKMIFDRMSEVFSDETMLKQFKSYDTMIPAKGPIRVGDTWNTENEMKIPFLNVMMREKTEYKLIGIEKFQGRLCAKIAVKTSMGSIPEKDDESVSAVQSGQKKTPFENMKTNFKMSDGSGIAYVDYAKSELVKSQNTMRMTIELTVKNGSGENAAEGHVVQKLFNSVSMELLEPQAEAAGK